MPRNGLTRLQVALLEDLAAALQQRLPLGALRLDPDRLRQQVVAAHADQRADALVGDVELELAEGVHPGAGVGVVAVHQGAVHVQDHAADARGSHRSTLSSPTRP